VPNGMVSEAPPGFVLDDVAGHESRVVASTGVVRCYPGQHQLHTFNLQTAPWYYGIIIVWELYWQSLASRSHYTATALERT
jgi:hypothetical protein